MVVVVDLTNTVDVAGFQSFTPARIIMYSEDQACWWRCGSLDLASLVLKDEPVPRVVRKEYLVNFKLCRIGQEIYLK